LTVVEVDSVRLGLVDFAIKGKRRKFSYLSLTKIINTVKYYLPVKIFLAMGEI